LHPHHSSSAFGPVVVSLLIPWQLFDFAPFPTVVADLNCRQSAAVALVSTFDLCLSPEISGLSEEFYSAC
jgi:hypothetical protein